MPGEVNCIYTKILIPFLEREVGPEAGAAVCRAAGRSRDYLMADHNWLPGDVVLRLVRLGQQLMGDPDEEHWLRRWSEFSMDWKPREERSYIGTWSMGLGDPRAVFRKADVQQDRGYRGDVFEVLEVGRTSARLRGTPRPGFTTPRWICVQRQTSFARFPTNWGLPRAEVVERTCATRGDDCCLFEVRWRNPGLGREFWLAAGVGGTGAVGLSLGAQAFEAASAAILAIAAIPMLGAGVAGGVALREARRRRHTQRLLDLQSEEIMFSNEQLEKKFQDLEEKIETIEELSRGLEDKVRVRTEQLRTSNEELQAAYRELQATQVQLVHREKMASVGQLVAGVAHELNNPIGFVYSNVGTLEDFVRRLRAMLEVYRAEPLPAETRERLQAAWDTHKIDYALKYLDSMTQGIKEGAERARKIVRDLRVFARSQDDVWQSVDLHEELDSSLTLLNHLLKDRVGVERILGDRPEVECVRSQIDQVFLNLLANAAQAITGRGVISIATRVEGDHAVVAIADSGPGIAPEVIGRVFDPFFTTKPLGEGTGLGLSISYEIARKHGGDLRAESPPGGGALFTLRLPLVRMTLRKSPA